MYIRNKHIYERILKIFVEDCYWLLVKYAKGEPGRVTVKIENRKVRPRTRDMQINKFKITTTNLQRK